MNAKLKYLFTALLFSMPLMAADETGTQYSFADILEKGGPALYFIIFLYF